MNESTLLVLFFFSFFFFFFYYDSHHSRTNLSLSLTHTHKHTQTHHFCCCEQQAGSTESLPLIASSIMSKKIAENPRDGLVLDVKTGSGAFLQEWDASVALGEAMVGAGAGAGIPTVALLTSMDQPLGRTVRCPLSYLVARALLRLVHFIWAVGCGAAVVWWFGAPRLGDFLETNSF